MMMMMTIVVADFTEKMEDVEAPPNKYQKTEVCSSDKSTSEEKTRGIPLLRGYHVQILEAGIGKVRSELFRKKIIELGGTLCSNISDHPNALVVDENMTADRLYRLLKVEGPQKLENVTVVRSLWLSDCIKNKKFLPTETYELQLSDSFSAVSSGNVTPSSSAQPRQSPPAVLQDVPQCSKFAYSRPNEDSDADSNYAASGNESEDDALHANSEAVGPQRRPLPVRVLPIRVELAAKHMA